MVPHTAVGPSCRRFLRAPCKNDGCRMSTFSNNSGKIGLDPFRQLLLPYRGKVRKEVVKGPAFGVDTAVIDLGNNLGLAVSRDRKSTRLNSSHVAISYAVFCSKKKRRTTNTERAA